MNGGAKIAPSLLCADQLNLGLVINQFNGLDIQWFHVDVMDGNFVPNLAFGTLSVSQICGAAEKPVYAHLMAKNPADYIENFAGAGVSVFTFHIEAEPYPFRLAKKIRDAGMLCGVAVSPITPASVLKPLLPFTDVVTLMAVEPGFSGQKFLISTLDKIKELRRLSERLNHRLIIEVDGGLDNEIGIECVKQGADVLVGGMFNLFLPGKDLKECFDRAMKSIDELGARNG